MKGHPFKQVPLAKTGMLIRRPVGEVFEAFVDPDITTKFWFTRSSGRLDAGKQVRWHWEMYDISIPVALKSIEPNWRIPGRVDGVNDPRVHAAWERTTAERLLPAVRHPGGLPA